MSQFRVDDITDSAGTGAPSFSQGISVDTISESTAATGVTLDGVLLKDGQINTGQGLTEVYLMDQSVRTTDSPTFDGMTVTGDANFDSGTLFVDVSTDRVGIGTTSPSTDLHISSSSAVFGLVATSSASSVAAWQATSGSSNTQYGFTNVGSGRTYISNSNDGGGTNNHFNMGFGTVTSGIPNTTVIKFDQAGNVFNFNDSTTWNTTSDERVKTNVSEVNNALEKMCNLHPVHFEYIHKPGKAKTGFIAQEFETVLPGHVIEAEPSPAILALKPELEGELIKGLELDLIPYLVKASQELKGLIDGLEGRVQALEGS